MLPGLEVKVSAPPDKLRADAQRIKAEFAGIEASARKTGKGVTTAGTAIGGIGRAAAANTNALRNVSLQLSQVGQQAAVTGNFMGALAVQLPDILGGFGGLPFVLAGAASGFAVMLLPAIMEAMDGAAKLDATLDELADTVDALSAAHRRATQPIGDLTKKYGAFAGVARMALEAQREFARVEAAGVLAAASMDIVNSLEALTSTQREAGTESSKMTRQIRRLARDLQIAEADAVLLRIALGQLADAEGPQEQARIIGEMIQDLQLATGGVENMNERTREFYQRLLDAALAASELASIDMASNVGAAADEAGRLASNLDVALGAAASLGQAMKIADEDILMGQQVLPDANTRERQRSGFASFQRRAAKAGRRGGGGAKVDPLAKELEAVQKALQTQTEAVEAQYKAQTDTIQSAYEKRLLSQEEYQRLSERSAAEYAVRMLGINEGYTGTSLDQAQTFFGDMATAFQSGNDKMLKISQAFAASEALINAWRGYSQVIADPRLPFFAKIPAALGVLSAGFNAVNSIKSLSRSGGGGADAGAAAGAASAPGKFVTLTLRGEGATIDNRDTLIREINGALDDGYVINKVVMS
jgi:hypothetical protein